MSEAPAGAGAGGGAGAPIAAHIGYSLARRQVEDLERICSGDLEIVEAPEDGEPGPFVVSLSTDGIAAGPGIRLRPRERFRIFVPEHFPFTHPVVFAEHRRWAETPHVQWGSYLCLYAAASVEWNAGDGMRGFIERLLAWLENAAAATLDPDDRPLHPPASSGAAKHGRLIVRPDLGRLVPWSRHGPVVPDADSRAEPDVVYGWCVRDGDRFEVLEWLTAVEAYNRVLAEDLQVRDPRGRSFFVVPLAMLETHLGWEYPKRAADLAGHLERSGLGQTELLKTMITSARMNRLIRMADSVADATEADGLDSDPILLGLATPSRRVAHDRLAHVAAWKIDDLGTSAISLLRRLSGLDDPPAELVESVNELARGWIETADLAWVRVHEMRPEVTRRRDDGTSGAWLRDQRVLLLGAGAIGAVTAEQIVRAGASRLVVVDNGDVNPGILVRQPYYDDEVGEAKVDALASRLNRIVRVDLVEPVEANCHQLLLDGSTGGVDGFVLDSSEFDLVIDATADAGTRAILEQRRNADTGQWPPVVTMLLGHRATRALAVVSGRGAACSSHELLRRFAVRGRGPTCATWEDLVDDFFPDPPRTEMFFPEPGCSEPTFVGSSSDVAALASTMLGYALATLAGIESQDASARMRVAGFRSASVPDAASGIRRGAWDEMVWHDDLVATDAGSGFVVRLTAEAVAEMRSEVRRGARARGPLIETGGLMLGSFDEATMAVTVDVVTGPAPDSLLSQSYFLHGVEGTQDALDSYKKSSRGLTRFVGLWHCHPYGLARPSDTDKAGITVLTSFTTGARRSLMVILAGSEQRWEDWVERGTGLPEAYVQVVTADATPGGAAGNAPPGPSGHDLQVAYAALTPYQRMLQSPPIGQYFAGGFSDRLSARGEDGP